MGCFDGVGSALLPCQGVWDGVLKDETLENFERD
jgi:hypothetical protein